MDSATTTSPRQISTPYGYSPAVPDSFERAIARSIILRSRCSTHSALRSSLMGDDQCLQDHSFLAGELEKRRGRLNGARRSNFVRSPPDTDVLKANSLTS